MKKQLVLAIAALFSSSALLAAPTTITASQVDIDFDPDNFLLQIETPSFGSKVWTTLASGTTAVASIGNGVSLNFGNQMQVSADAGTTFGMESYSGIFSIPLSFSAHSGYRIDSYSITYTGTYDLSNAGSVFAGGTGSHFADSVYAAPGAFNKPFSVTGTISGSSLPTLVGNIEAIADYGTIQVYDGTISQLDHYEYQDIRDDYGNLLYTQEIPVYIDVPVYHDEGIIGSANINLQSIQITANVAAVPEPETYALLLSGLGIITLLSRRNRAQG